MDPLFVALIALGVGVALTILMKEGDPNEALVAGIGVPIAAGTLLFFVVLILGIVLVPLMLIFG